MSWAMGFVGAADSPIGWKRDGRMRRLASMKPARLHLLALVAFALVWTLPQQAAASPTIGRTVATEKPEAALCGGHLTRLRGVALAKTLTARRISFANDAGACAGGIRIGNYWYLELTPDGHYTLQADRGKSGGVYDFRNDQLCLDKAPSAKCANFYRDEAGRVYMFGPPNTSSVPAMLRDVRATGD